MSPKSSKRILRILDLRKKRVEDDIARMRTGMEAGQSLRGKLEGSVLEPRFSALTVNYMTRTVSIIDRGLAVLSEQKANAISERQRVEARQKLLGNRAAEAAEIEECRANEDSLGEWLTVSGSS